MKSKNSLYMQIYMNDNVNKSIYSKLKLNLCIVLPLYVCVCVCVCVIYVKIIL